MITQNPLFVAVLLLIATTLSLQQPRTGNAAEVMFRRADDTVFESDLPVQFELLLQPSELIDEDITVQILTISSTAVGDTDYNSSAINVTFPVEDTSYRAFFEISLYNDNLVEGNETFLLVIDNSSLPEDVSLGRPHQLNVTITEGNETPFILATIINDSVRNEQVLLPRSGIYLWPVQPIQRIVFECISTEGSGQINLTSLNQTSVTSQIGFNMFPTSLNGFLVCRSDTSEEEQSVYVANATMAGGIAVPLTPSPLTVIQGESSMVSYLIALVDESLNVSSSIKVEHFYDGELFIIINELDNDRYNIIFSPVEYGFSIEITFNRRPISTIPFVLDVQPLEVADNISIPQDQRIFEGQNAYFNCLLNGTNGRLIPAMWRVDIVDMLSFAVTMNTTEYLLLPPANSTLVVVHPTDNLFITCNGGTTRSRYTAQLRVEPLPRDCSVDNRDCEEDCGTPLQDGSYCRCPENQTLIGTSCVSQSTYFSIYGEVYEDSDIFIHHPLYHVGPFEIMCNSLDENAIAEQGQWIIQAFNSSTTVAFNGGTVFLSNSSVNASATLRGVESFGQATLTVDQPVEGYFTCIVNNVSHTIRVITGGEPLLEFLTQEPVYVTEYNRRLTVLARGFVVNSFGKTIQATQSHFAVTVVNVSSNFIESYDMQTGELVSLFPQINLETEFNINKRLVEISLTSATNFIAATLISPVFARIINVTSNSSQNVFTEGELILTCFTIPSDLPVTWIYYAGPQSRGKQLTGDSRAIIQSTDYGSRLTLRNTTAEDSGKYQCNFNDGFSELLETATVTIIPDTVSIVIQYVTWLTEEFKMDFPVHESLYVIQETLDTPIFDFQLLCYNLESDSFNDTEIIFSNPNPDLNEIPHKVSDDMGTIVSFEQFTPSINGNVTCRSRRTGKQSTVYIANATLSGAYVMRVTQSPIYALRGTTVIFTYRIGLTNNSLDVITNVRARITIDSDEPLLIHRGNDFYDVEISNVPRSMDVYLEYNGRRVSTFAIIYAQDIVITPNPLEYAVGKEGENITISCVPDIVDTVMQWQKDSVPISSNGLKYTFGPPELHHTLTIHNATTSDSGRYTCMPSVANDTTITIQVFVINEPLAFLSNGTQLPQQAIYNLVFPVPVNLICAGSDGNDKLQIETDHKDLPSPLNTGLHYTTGGSEISVSEFDSAINIVLNINVEPFEETSIMEPIEFTCISQRSKATATFSIIPEQYAVISSELIVQVAYLNPLVLQYVVAVNSNGTHSQLDTLTDYRVQFVHFSENHSIEYNMSSIKLVSGNIFQLTIPQANMSHNGTYTFSANFQDGTIVQDSTEVTVVFPNTTINGSYPNVLVGQTVKLFCYITLPESVTVSDNINYTVNWSHGQERVYQSSAVGSLVHSYMIVNASLSDSGEYACTVHVSKPADVSEPPDLFNLSVFSDPISIGYAPIAIIPDGNVVNFNCGPHGEGPTEEIPGDRQRRQPLIPLSVLALFCYATGDHENAVWEIPSNSFFNPTLSVMSPYQSALYFNNSVFGIVVESFVCRSSNNRSFNSSVIVTNNQFFIEPLSPNPFVIKYFQPLTLSFQVALCSDGIRNSVHSIFVDGPGYGELSNISSIASSSQVFVEDVGVAGSRTAGNYTALFMYGDFYENSTVEVIVEIPGLVATQSIIHVLTGENVTVGCIPSDSSLALQWVVTTRIENEVMIPSPAEIEGSAGEEVDGRSDDEDELNIDSDLTSRLLYQLPLVHQVTLINTAVTDSGYFTCSIVPPPHDSALNNNQEITLNVLPNAISIGYSFDTLIPENNVINLDIQQRNSRGVFGHTMFCFTTLGHEDAPWVVSTNNFSTGPLFNGTNTVDLGSGKVLITIDRFSPYHSSIYIDDNDADFTANLTCQSQSNPAVHYTVIITTSHIYFQSLLPNPLVASYLQPVNLTFLVVVGSNGISNNVEMLVVFHYDTFGNPTGEIRIPGNLDQSTQRFILDLGYAEASTAGEYAVFNSEGLEVGRMQVVVDVPTLTVPSSNITVLSGETITLQCTPSDPELELYWTYESSYGSGIVTVNNISRSRFSSGSSLLHQLILPNATTSDTGNYSCVVQSPPDIDVAISERLSVTISPGVINIGYSPDLIIPADNVINVDEEASIGLSCFTTLGYENPAWAISSNGIAVTLRNDETTTLNENITVTVTRVSVYHSDIYIEVNGTDFTSSLICRSENNLGVQSEVILTTSDIYFKSLLPNPLVASYSQPVNLTFLVVVGSDGISNNVEMLGVFHYDTFGNPTGQLRIPGNLGLSTQRFVLELGYAGASTAGEYAVFNSEGLEVGRMRVVVDVPSLTAVTLDDRLSGETVVFECRPSDPNVVLYWTYQTNDGNGSVTIDTISQSRFLSGSPQLHQLILPIATVSDTGIYTCVVQGPLEDDIISQTISLTVLPACGSLDRLSHGVLWPITRAGKVAETFCSDFNPSFGFGPYATRRCREDTTWSPVDTSNCSIRPMQQSTIVVYSTFVEEENISNSNQLSQLRKLYNDSSMIYTELIILPERLYVRVNTDVIDVGQSQVKRQITSARYSLLAPVIYTVNVLNRNLSVENVTDMIESVDDSAETSEIIEFNAVDVCECASNLGDLQQSSTVKICVGTSLSPCICNSSGCRCNPEGYTGNDALCARDSDRDSFPDVPLNCSSPTCLEDKCPFIATEDGQDESSCRPLPNDVVGCSQEIDPYYGINWPSVRINVVATNSCPEGTGTAVRSCGSNGQWRMPVVTNCSSYEYRSLMTLMTQVNSTAELNALTSSLILVSNKTENETTSSYPADLMNSNSILAFSLDYIEQNPEALDSEETVQNIADCFSNLLSPENNAGWMELEESSPGQSQMLLMNSERYGLLLAENLETGSMQVVVSENIAIMAEVQSADNVSDVTFPDPTIDFNTNNSIFIPASYIQERSMTTGIDPIPIVNIAYDNIHNILPPVNNEPVSPVLSSQVTGVSDSSTQFAVQLTFEYSNTSTDSVPVCGYWNFSRGGWDTEGVTVVSNAMNSSTITCNSNHLTSFAVLVDVSDGHQDISDEESTALSIVSYVGCGISIVCLVIAIIILCYYRNTLLKGIHNFIHLNLAIALILALTVFAFGIELGTNSDVVCQIVAVLLHYLFTAVFSWMLCEGIMLYFLLVKVFNTGVGQREWFYLVIGWGIPVPIVAVSVGIAHDDYGNDDFCWIDTDNGAIWGFVAPMLAIIFVNVIFLFLALHALYKSKRGRMTEEEASQATIVKTMLKATVILLPLLGITWVFGLLAVNQESSVFAWIFCILNSLQGMFILVFHLIRNEKIWHKIVSCFGDSQYSSFIPSSQRSSTASRGARIKKSIQTDSTNPPPSYDAELKSKLDSSNFPESSGIDTTSKSFDSVAETENEKPPIADSDVRVDEEEAVTTTTFSVDVKVPSNEETDL